jgi:mannitol operon transcriptional antiterminator
MLAAEGKPLQVKEVADRLRVSKRTVFRELANIGSVLEPYGLEVSSIPGEGVTLEGSPRAMKSLVDDLNKLGAPDPADRRDRRDKLILAVLQTPGRKLATYAERLKVSASTISHDLDDIQPWLAGRNLSLHRKPGMGIAIAGEEMSVRRAVLALIRRAESPGGYPRPDILLDILDGKAELEPALHWITPQSRDALDKYMWVMTQRIMDGRPLSVPGRVFAEFSHIAERLSRVLEETFNISLNRGEVGALTVELASCRPILPSERKDKGDGELAALAAEMIALFDPAQAHVLSMDEALVSGLVSHLRTALVRIRHGIELTDPMRDQIIEKYPDTMNRCRAACEVLRRFGGGVPEDEISLVATHFGAALLRLSESGAMRRPVRVGVICVHGVGSSYLLASQVKKAFGARVIVEVAWHDDAEQWLRYDVLVSTTELPGLEMPVIVTPPILREGDIGRIDEALMGGRGDPVVREKPPTAFVEDLRRMEELLSGAADVIENFSVTALSDNANIREMAARAGDVFGETPDASKEIADGLMAREKISTQAVRELSVVLLHCRTAGVKGPRFGVMTPAGGVFAGSSFKDLKSAVVMLIPEAASRELSEMMGSLSAALIEQERFLRAVQAGASPVIQENLSEVLRAYLSNVSVQKLKG